MLVSLAGGVGLFLLGMVLLTDGLKALAGRALKQALQVLVRGPVSGIATGAAVTGMVQSSTATTLTTIGFVSAGLMTFPQAIGVILGANVGTTSTGWLVSVLGFKVSLGAVSLPVVLVGALLRVIGRERVAAAGIALAGFGLIFFGIDVLQAGMAHLSERIQPGDLPGDGLPGRLVLVAAGIVMTIVMQSSSAAMAATLVALDSGTINFEQAAALAIGQNIGTTATAALAAIGASTPARRTALAHVLFNVFTGVAAFAAFGLLVRAAQWLAGGEADNVLALAIFHSLFNLGGVALVFPLLTPFSRVIERIVPERGPSFTQYLDRSVAQLGPVAIESARRASLAVLAALMDSAATILEGRRRTRGQIEQDAAARAALDEINAFLAKVAEPTQRAAEMTAQVNLVHALDHLDELAETCQDEEVHPAHLSLPAAAPAAARVREVLRRARPAVADERPDAPLPDLSGAMAEIAELRRGERKRLLEETAAGRMPPREAEESIEAIRWADRVAYHVARAVYYLQPPPARGVEAISPSGEAVSLAAPGESGL